MSYQLIGLRSTGKFFDYEHSGDDYEECYDLLLKETDTKEKVIVTVGIEIGECYSGYCSAQWLHKEIKKVDNFGPFTHKPKKPIFYENLEDIASYDYNVRNEVIDISIYDDGYYPSASISVNFNEFEEADRAKDFIQDKKVIYIFFGDSATGKSTIASKSFDKVLETDSKSSEDISDSVFNFDYDCIVLGNKHGFGIEWLKSLISSFSEDYNFIYVNFKK